MTIPIWSPPAGGEATETSSLKPGGGGTIFSAVQADPAAQMFPLDVQRYRFVTVIVQITTLGNITALNVVGRTSGKANPGKDAPADWAAVLADNLDPATGISTVRNYQPQAVGAVGRFSFRYPCDSGSSFSAQVWVDDATGSIGDVFAYRSA